MNKRELAAHVLGHPNLSRLRTRVGSLRILAYHRVVERGGNDWDGFAFDEELISATPEAFDEQMRFAQKNFDVVSFRDLAQCEDEGRGWPSRALVVTFDDGYRDNYSNAFPILRELGLSATIFLATGHIGGTRLFWWDTIAFCFKHTALASVQLTETGEAPLPLESRAQKRAAINAVLKWAKCAPEAERCAFIGRLPAALDVTLPANIADQMHLSWDEVRLMAQGGIEFGSHTVTHPILAHVDTERLRFEACASKAAIEREVGAPVLTFAYPAGTKTRRTESTRAMVEACGYRFAVAYDQNVESNPDRYALPRIHVDRDQSLDLFRANLLFPGFMLRS